MIVLDSTATVYGDQKYPFVVDDQDNYITQASTLSINRAITVYTRLAGQSPSFLSPHFSFELLTKCIAF